MALLFDRLRSRLFVPTWKEFESEGNATDIGRQTQINEKMFNLLSKVLPRANLLVSLGILHDEETGFRGFITETIR